MNKKFVYQVGINKKVKKIFGRSNQRGGACGAFGGGGKEKCIESFGGEHRKEKIF